MHSCNTNEKKKKMVFRIRLQQEPSQRLMHSCNNYLKIKKKIPPQKKVLRQISQQKKKGARGVELRASDKSSLTSLQLCVSISQHRKRGRCCFSARAEAVCFIHIYIYKHTYIKKHLSDARAVTFPEARASASSQYTTHTHTHTHTHTPRDT